MPENYFILPSATFGKCRKCQADLSGEKCKYFPNERKIECINCATIKEPKKPLPVAKSTPKSGGEGNKVYRIKVNHAFAHSKNIPMHLSVSFVKETEKAVLVKGFFDSRESINCLHCGRTLENPNSRLVGYGPVCCENLGIARPDFDRMTGRDLEKLRGTIKSKEFEGWIPKCVFTILEVKEEVSRVEKMIEKPLQKSSLGPGLGKPVATNTGYYEEKKVCRFTRRDGSQGIGAFTKLRRYPDIKTSWEGEGENTRQIVYQDGRVISIENLYIPHPEGLF